MCKSIILKLYYTQKKCPIILGTIKKWYRKSLALLTSEIHPNLVDLFPHWTCLVHIERLILWHELDLRMGGEFHSIVGRVGFYLKSEPAELLTWDIAWMTYQRCSINVIQITSQNGCTSKFFLKEHKAKWGIGFSSIKIVPRRGFANLQFFKDFLHFGALGEILVKAVKVFKLEFIMLQ